MRRLELPTGKELGRPSVAGDTYAFKWAPVHRPGSPAVWAMSIEKYSEDASEAVVQLWRGLFKIYGHFVLGFVASTFFVLMLRN